MGIIQHQTNNAFYEKIDDTNRDIVLDTIFPEFCGWELFPGDSSVSLSDGDTQTHVGSAVVHGQDTVQDVIIIGQSHAEEAVAGKQVARVLDNGSFWQS